MKDQKSAKKQIVLIMVSVAILVLMVFVINTFISRVQENESAIAENNLLVAANNGAALITKTINGYMRDLETIALVMEKQDNLRSESTISLLKEIAALKGYERLAIDFADGTSYTSDGKVLDVSSQGYSTYIQNRQPYITDVLPSVIDGVPLVCFLVPLHMQDETQIASVRLAMRTDRLAKDIDLLLFDAEGYYHLVDQRGSYVAVGMSGNALLMDENYFDAIELLEYSKGYSKEGIMQTFLDGVPTYSKYSVGNEERIAYCQPVINNWVLMTIVPTEVITKQAKQNISFASNMTIQLAVILILGFVAILIQQNRVKQSIELSDKCFRALTEQTGKLIFEWDYKNKKLTSMSNFGILTGTENTIFRTAEESLEMNMVHPNDIEQFMDIYKQLDRGENVKDIKIRLRYKDGTFHWCLFSVILVKDSKGRNNKAIGSIEDINDFVNKEEKLIRNSERDQLTGLFNKVTTEKQIKKHLESRKSEEVNVLMVIDIDDFKNVNDRLGHHYGDLVLKNLAYELTQIFGQDSIIGRIGGDEFFVFMKDYKSKSEVKAKAAHVCDVFRKNYVDGEVECRISASIGICYVPEHGTSFDEIYQRADMALYRTKEKGKNNYSVYDGIQVHSNYISNRTKIEG